jgi:hypothetical protein
MPCRDLFRYLGNRRLSGTLTARRAGVEKRVVIHEGAAVSAASTDAREYLGQILINAGLLTEEQFNRAYQTQLETRVPLGQILTMIGLVPEEEVRKALAIKVRETALELCDWRSGGFEFSSHAPTLQGGVPHAVPLVELCQDSEARGRAWTAIHRVLPSGETRLEQAPGASPAYAHASLEARILRLAAENRSIDEMLVELHATEYGLYQRLYTLVQEGVLRVQRDRDIGGDTAVQVESWFPEETPAPPREPPLSVAQLVERANAALAAGSYAEAVEIAGRAVDQGVDPAANAILEKAEGRLLLQLREELLGQPRIPALAVDKAQIKAMPLNPPERYLLARMDGIRELGSVVRVSPLREVDALRLVKRFAREGLIRFG